MVVGLAVFVVTYLLVIARRLRWLPIGRPAGALVGAVLAVATGAIGPEQAYRSIDHATIALLFGMMVIGVHLERGGAFRRVAAILGARPRSPKALLCVVAVASGIASAILVNDAVCLIGTPVVLAVSRARRLAPLPFLIALATGSNVGGVMTLTGTPQCMIVGRLGSIGYRAYAASMVPVGLVGLLILCAVLLATHRGPLLERPAGGATEPLAAEERALLLPSLAAVAFVTAGFLLRFDLAWTALAGAALVLVLVRRDAGDVLARVDWSVLVFFAGLFVVVGALRTAGVMDAAFGLVRPWLRGDAAAVAPFAVASVFGSNLLSNVPYVLLVAPWIDHLAESRLMWLTLAMASTFAGNLTLLGSVANVIVAEGARDEGGIGFLAYLRVGFPTTILTTLAGSAILIAFEAAGWVRWTAAW
jgi:Na+/H+ antiporter NhaD/arsenite permease-like protein